MPLSIDCDFSFDMTRCCLNMMTETINIKSIFRFGRLALSAVLVLMFFSFVTSCGTHRNTSPNAYINRSGDKPKKDADIKPDQVNEPSSTLVELLIAEARTWIGTPYRYGGKEKTGADCSGFVMMVYKNAANIALPRTSKDQCNFCTPIEKELLVPGDLVFFSSNASGGNVAHVGMYIGEGKMIHASSTKGVTESSISMKYYVDHYLTGGRIPGMDNITQDSTPDSIVKNAFKKN